jgi:hypothetical protein
MTVQSCSLISEPVGPQGGVVADVMSNSISTSTYTQSETFIREMLQNSCDQRVNKTSSIDFLVDVASLSGSKKSYLNQFLETAKTSQDPLDIAGILKQPEIEVIYVADRGTAGLNGPVDASIDSKESNFAGFFFNVGRPTTESSTGGSFGLGRTVLTNASQYSTVIVFSQFFENSSLHSRLMGMAIARSFNADGKKYTGRHWLGISANSSGTSVKPFEGSAAIRIAEQLGLKSYLGQETGFVAMVLGNALLSSHQASTSISAQRRELALQMQQAAYHYGWPHMIKTNNSSSVDFSFKHDGTEIEMQDPEKIPVIQDYVACFKAQATKDTTINSKEIMFTASVKKRPTGLLTWYQTPINQNDEELAKEEIIPKSSIALIRQANFVVKYLPVTPPSDGVTVRGVFKTNAEFDATFRKSEPVAHDDWVPTKLQLPPLSRNPVKQTLEAIRSTFKGLELQSKLGEDGDASVMLGNIVGRLLDGLQLTGQRGRSPGSAGSTGTSKPRPGIKLLEIGFPMIVSSNSKAYSSQFKYQIMFGANASHSYEAQFIPASILENGSIDSNPPVGVIPPTIARISIDGRAFPVEKPLTLIGEYDGKYVEIEIRNSQGVGTACEIKIEESNE